MESKSNNKKDNITNESDESIKKNNKKKQKDIKDDEFLTSDNVRSSVTRCSKAKDKATFNFLEVIIIMIITALFGAFIGSSVVYFSNGNNAELRVENTDLAEFVATYNNLLSDHYTKLDKNELLAAGIKGMIEYLDDPYSAYMDKQESDSFNQQIDGNYVGMGVEIQQKEDKSIVIVTIFDGSPAQKAGFMLGDTIVKVGDKSVAGMDADDVVKLIKGKAGTKVKITVKRDGKEKVMEITRAAVDIPSVSSEVFDNNGKKVGYIRIEVFARNTAIQFEEALKKLELADVKGLIIDVRGNSGGYLSVVTEIASKFLDNNDVVYQLETKGVIKKVYALSVEKCTLPVIMLVDGGSASASEILASALSENNSSVLIGTKTFGKGTVQQAYQLNNGATIKYTIQAWLTPKGNKIDKVGVLPTKEIKLNEEYYKNPISENDNQLQAAISAILE